MLFPTTLTAHYCHPTDHPLANNSNQLAIVIYLVNTFIESDQINDHFSILLGNLLVESLNKNSPRESILN